MFYKYEISRILIALGCIPALLNWGIFFYRLKTGRFKSTAPIIGGLFLASGMALDPELRIYAWTALIMDFGTLDLLSALPRIVSELSSTSRFNLLAEFEGHSGIRTVKLRLFKKNVYTISQEFTRKKDEFGLIKSGDIGSWNIEADSLLLRSANSETARLRRSKDGSELTVETGFEGQKGGELSLDGLTLVAGFRDGKATNNGL